jgi:hypothetical protein
MGGTGPMNPATRIRRGAGTAEEDPSAEGFLQRSDREEPASAGGEKTHARRFQEGRNRP